MTRNLGFYQANYYTKNRSSRWLGKQDIIVFHVTDGAAGLKEYANNPKKNPALFSGSMGTFCHPSSTKQTSSHFILDRYGNFLQVVKFEDMAWCNGNTPAHLNLKGVKPIIRSRTDNANLYTYSIECEGYSAIGDPPVTDDELEAMVECMCLCIDNMYENGCKTFRPDDDHIIGHCHIRPDNRQSCPSKNFGEKFPFAYLIEKAEEYCNKKYPGWIPDTGDNDTPSTGIGDTEGNTGVPGTTVGIQVGDQVNIINGATWYGSTSKISSLFIDGKIYTVDELQGNRAVLDKKGICSPIDVKYLVVVTHAETPDDKIAATFNVGDQVTINAGAKWTTGQVVPNWAIGGVYHIDALTDNIALLDKSGICSSIDVKYLTKLDDDIRVGDKVKIISGAKWTTGKNVPSWVLSNNYTVDSLSDGIALLGKGGINSKIDVRYLQKL